MWTSFNNIGHFSGAATLQKLAGSTSSLTKPEGRGRSGSCQSIDSTTLKYGSDLDIAMRSVFDQVRVFAFLLILLYTLKIISLIMKSIGKYVLVVFVSFQAVMGKDM